MKAVIRTFSPSPKKNRGSTGSDSDLMSAAGSPRYDLLIFGASGFTGRLCAEYVASRYADKIAKFTWAVAGRSASKLQEVTEELACKNLPEIVIADSQDYASVHAMCKSTFVVLNCAGPFERFGTPVVEACAATGTNYCDITGELHWVKEMESRYGATAAQTGALIIPMCGFDSVPSDIGTFMVVLHMAEAMSLECASVKAFHHDMRGMVSGGTLSTMMGMFNRPVGELLRLAGVVSDLYALNPKGGWRGGDSELWSESHVPWFDIDMMMATAPFAMSLPNTRVVRRSAGILGYGQRFRYSEVYAAEWNPFDVALGLALWLLPFLVIAAALFPPLRWFLNTFVLPAPGQGPSKQMRESGRFKMTLVGRTEAPPPGKEGGPAMVVGTVEGTQDPGYGETAKMAVECAMAIVVQKHLLPGRDGGFHTPATGIGRALIERLKAAGMTLRVEEA